MGYNIIWTIEGCRIAAAGSARALRRRHGGGVQEQDSERLDRGDRGGLQRGDQDLQAGRPAPGAGGQGSPAAAGRRGGRRGASRAGRAGCAASRAAGKGLGAAAAASGRGGGGAGPKFQDLL